MASTTPPKTPLGETLAPPPRPSGHIATTPGACGGKPHIAGHRIKVSDIVLAHEHLKQSPAQIVESLPTINLGQVHAALSYYYDHRGDIDAEIQADDDYFNAMRQAAVSKIES